VEPARIKGFCAPCYGRKWRERNYDPYKKTSKERFEECLLNQYGEEIFSDLEYLRKMKGLRQWRVNKGRTLAWLGEKYEFSRENARQMFNKYCRYREVTGLSDQP